MESQNLKTKTQNLIPRSSIVVVLGHVDHGKTTLLDYIRKTNVVAKEAGGITQATGAYEITHAGKKITFIDTPGHAAFSKMRQRGAKAADLGILVVAADEGVKPQTKEAIEVLLESKTPFVVALNKIDRNNADIDRTKADLAKAGLLLEGFGGNISWQGISAKTGEGVNELLDLILLAAEMEDLKYDPEARANGFIIESKMDNRRGLTVAAIVKNGVLRQGDDIVASGAVGKVKILENFLGEKVKELSPSSPALILGFESLPQIGDEFFSGKVDLSEFMIAPLGKTNGAFVPSVDENGENVETLVKLILKADVSGSLEAISEIIKTMPDVRIIHEGIGDITDTDVKNASSSKAIIASFKAKVSKAAENLAKVQDVKIISSEIIYELLKKIEEEVKALQEPEKSNEMKILAVFGKKGNRQVIGGKCEIGEFKKNSSVEILRDEKSIGRGRVINLQKGKADTSLVGEEEECGILLDSEAEIKAGDKLIY
ncbi:MAG: translation initiation factor IF-2 [Candidatus Paceibacterota bacterium]